MECFDATLRGPNERAGGIRSSLGASGSRHGGAVRSWRSKLKPTLNVPPKDSTAGPGRRKIKLALGDQLIVSGANFLVGFLLARALGPAGYGQFTLTFNLILFALGIQGALITSPMMVLGAAVTRERSGEYFPALVAGQLGLCMLAGLVLLLSLATMRHFAPQWGVEGLSLPLLFAMSGYLCLDFCRRYLFVRERAAAAVVVDSAADGSKFALLVALALASALKPAPALYTIGAATTLGVALTVVFSPERRAWRWPGYESWRRTMSAHWHLGKWLVADGIALWCGTQVVMYVTGKVISLSVVGAMAAAWQIVGVTNVLNLALENVVPSRAAQAYASEGEPALSRYLWRVVLLGGAGTLSILAIAALGAEFWLRLFYGAAYAGNGRLVIWFALYAAIGFIHRPLSAGLRAMGNTRPIFYATFGGTVVAAVLTYPAVRVLGVDGAMLSMCLVQAAILWILWRSYRATISAPRRSVVSNDTEMP